MPPVWGLGKKCSGSCLLNFGRGGLLANGNQPVTMGLCLCIKGTPVSHRRLHSAPYFSEAKTGGRNK